MTDFNEQQTQGAPPSLAPPAKHRWTTWARTGLVAGAMLGGMAVGAGGLAFATTAGEHLEWRRGHHLEHLQRMVHGALDSVGATTTQEDKVHDIIANGFASMTDGATDRGAMRQQVLDLLRSPTIDRAAVEKLRTEQVARFDEKSKAITGMVLDAASSLTPDQRAKLADRAEAMMQWHSMGWRRGGEPDGGRMEPGRRDPGEDQHGPGDPGMRTESNPG